MAQSRYTRGAIILHWLIALLIIGQLCGGLYMVGIPDAQASLKFQIFQLHKSFGVTILLLSIVRVAWRLTHQVTPLPEGMAGWEKIAARATHIGFYILMFVTPLLGWAYVSVAPFNVPTVLFGVISWPHMPFFEGAANREALAESLAGFHEFAAFSKKGICGHEMTPNSTVGTLNGATETYA
ncbi:MAG: cytochrome b, partial [Amphiplicatus sp.]